MAMHMESDTKHREMALGVFFDIEGALKEPLLI
jgi:hypothetical protein